MMAGERHLQEDGALAEFDHLPDVDRGLVVRGCEQVVDLRQEDVVLGTLDPDPETEARLDVLDGIEGRVGEASQPNMTANRCPGVRGEVVKRLLPRVGPGSVERQSCGQSQLFPCIGKRVAERIGLADGGLGREGA